MRKNKTPKSKRTTYIYYSVDGTKTEITPDDAGEKWITMLHEGDDKEYDAQRRENSHVPIHYDAYSESDEEEMDDHNIFLTDRCADPADIIIRNIEEVARIKELLSLFDAIKKLTPKQRELIYKSFWRSKSNTQIANEEGVSETAIRKRLKTIYKTIYKKL